MVFDKWRKERKSKVAYRKAAEANIKKKYASAYYRAKEKEAERFAQKKARFESEQKFRRMQDQGGSGKFGRAAKQVSGFLGSLNIPSNNEGFGFNKPVQRRRKGKKRQSNPFDFGF